MKIVRLWLSLVAVSGVAQDLASVTPSVTQLSSGQRASVVFPGDLVFPHVVNGGGWSTTFVFTNLSTTDTEGFAVSLWDATGRSLNVGFSGVVGSNFSVRPLPPGGIAFIETDGTGSLQQGWGELVPNTKDAKIRIGGMAIFRQRVAGRQDAEAVVPLTSLFDKQIVMVYDNLNNFSTGIALVNGGGSQNTITATIRDGDGKTLATETFTMTSGQHLAFSTPQRFPLTANRRGSIVFATNGTSLSALGLRFSPSGSFTSFPPLTTPQLLGLQ